MRRVIEHRKEERIYDCAAVIFRSSETSAWVAACPTFDVITYGDSPAHAIAMIQDAVQMVVLDDLNGGHDPSDRAAPADDEYWQRLAQFQRGDETPMTPEERDQSDVLTDSESPIECAIVWKCRVHRRITLVLEEEVVPDESTAFVAQDGWPPQVLRAAV